MSGFSLGHVRLALGLIETRSRSEDTIVGETSITVEDTHITKHATVTDCREWSLDVLHRHRLITLVRDRFNERYLQPIQSSTERSGFLMMSVACFMIETLQCFRLGLGKL